MSLTSILVAIGELTPSGPVCPVDHELIAARRSAARILREDSWENEGGGLGTTRVLPLPRTFQALEIGTIHRAIAHTGNDAARS